VARTAALLAGLLLTLASPLAQAEISVQLAWERSLQLHLVDEQSRQPLARALVVVIREKGYPGVSASGRLIEAFRADAEGLLMLKASLKSTGATLLVTAPGYALLDRRLEWQQLFPGEMDKPGYTYEPVEVAVALRAPQDPGGWRSDFQLLVRPQLEELLVTPAQEISRAAQRVIKDYLEREKNRYLGL